MLEPRLEQRRCEICNRDTPHRHATGSGGDLPTDWDCTRCEENGSRRPVIRADVRPDLLVRGMTVRSKTPRRPGWIAIVQSVHYNGIRVAWQLGEPTAEQIENLEIDLTDHATRLVLGRYLGVAVPSEDANPREVAVFHAGCVAKLRCL